MKLKAYRAGWPARRVVIPYRSPDDAAWTDHFFAGYPEARRVWEQVVVAAQAWGPVQVVATKSRVALLGRTRFAWCPQAHKAGTILLRFIVPRPIDSPRVRNDTMPDGRTSARVRLESADGEAMAWLRAAHAFDTGR